MRKILIKGVSSITLSYVGFLSITFLLNREAKFIKWDDLRSGEDWFYFLWLYAVPLIIDLLVIGIPIFYGATEFAKSKKRLLMGVSILAGLGLSFLVSKTIYGFNAAILKSCICAITILFFFRKEVFYVSRVQ